MLANAKEDVREPLLEDVERENLKIQQRGFLKRR